MGPLLTRKTANNTLHFIALPHAPCPHSGQVSVPLEAPRLVVECEVASAGEKEEEEAARGDRSGIGSCLAQEGQARSRRRVAIREAESQSSSRGQLLVWDMPSGLLAHEALVAWGTLAAVLAAGLSIGWAAASRGLAPQGKSKLA
jgi:hypothetical protein